jgi:hypothetical protein
MFKYSGDKIGYDEFGFLMFIENMVGAGVKELYIIVNDNEAADKHDIIFEEPQQSPKTSSPTGPMRIMCRCWKLSLEMDGL